jgi:Ca2+:H+ antiporter
VSSARAARVSRIARAELSLVVALATVAFFLTPVAQGLPGAGEAVLALEFVWLLAVILGSTLRVVAHAEALAEALGEPYGTLVLTLSVTGIEVTMIAALMLHGAGKPTLARDTMFAVIMLVLNGMVGLILLLGALRHREQQYNLQGAGAYLSVVIPLAVLALVLPNYTTTTPGPLLSAGQALVLSILSVGLYGVFLTLQTRLHPAYFMAPEAGDDRRSPDPALDPGGGPAHPGPGVPLGLRLAFLIGYLAAVVVLAEQLALPLDLSLRGLSAPTALGGFLIAAVVLTPEGLGAIRAARDDQLQRAVNIALGSALATIGLSVPAVLGVSLATGRVVHLGLGAAETTLLAVTLGVSVLTFGSGRTNVLQGSVHLLLFLAYLLLLFEP